MRPENEGLRLLWFGGKNRTQKQGAKEDDARTNFIVFDPFQHFLHNKTHTGRILNDTNRVEIFLPTLILILTLLIG